jgi:hypothetical protein
MKYVYRSVLFHFVCILIFGYIYTLSKSEFSMEDGTVDAFDCLFLSITIQSGVGYTLITPTTHFSKSIIMIQQLYVIHECISLVFFYTNIGDFATTIRCEWLNYLPSTDSFSNFHECLSLESNTVYDASYHDAS